jgi:dUTPase
LSGQTGVPVHLSNRTDQPVTLRPGTRIAVIQAIEQTNVTQVGQRRMNINAISQSQGNNSQQQ